MLGRSVHTGWYIYNSLVHIGIIYLHVIDACLKVTIAMFCFYHSKNNSKIMKNIFNCISIYSRNKISFLKDIRSKCFMRKINLYFFEVMKNGKIFPSKDCHFQYDHGLGKWGTLKRVRRYFCKN